MPLLLSIILFQIEAIEQPEETASPTVLILVALFLLSIVTGFFLWLLLLRLSFFKKAIEVEGTVTGLIQARYSGRVSANIPYVGSIKSNDSNASGYLLDIEYEVGDYVYRTKSKNVHTDYAIGDRIAVMIREDDPEDCAIDGIYEINPKLAYGMVVGGTLSIILILAFLLFAN